jgi:hypothetical protein
VSDGPSGRETQHLDQKSLRKVTGKTADWATLAADCVCFANASGRVRFEGARRWRRYWPTDKGQSA